MASFRGTDLNVSPFGSLNATYNEVDNTVVLTYVDRDKDDRVAVIKLTIEESTRVLQQVGEIVQSRLRFDNDEVRDVVVAGEPATDPLPEGGFSGEGSPETGVVQPFFGTTETVSSVDTDLEKAIKDAQV